MADVDPDDIINEVGDTNLKEELRSCQHSLVDCELERVRHKVFNYAIVNLNSKLLVEKLDHFFDNLDRAVKVSMAFGFFLKNHRRWKVQIFLRIQKQCSAGSIQTCVHQGTKDDLAKLKIILNKSDSIQS